MSAQPVKIIAEVGCNHKGDLDIAKKMIRTVANFLRSRHR